MGRALLITCLCACGRYGFSPDVAPDAAAAEIDAAPDAPPAMLQCGQPTRFTMGAVTSLAIAAPPWGFGVFTTDASHVLHTSVYAFVGPDLMPMVQSATLASSATGTLGAATLGNNILLASATGVPTATGSIVYAIDSKGEEVAQPVTRTELAVTRPVAASGAGAGVVLASIVPGDTAVTGHVLDASGGDAVAATTIVAASPTPDTIELSPAGTGYAAVWGQAASGAHAIEMALYDSSLTLLSGPVVVDDLMYAAYRGSAVYAAQSNEYLVTWHEKNSGGGDDVWFTILDASLSVRVAPTLIANNGHDAVAASDGTGFWMIWDVYPSGPVGAHLDGAAISATGTVTPRAVTTTGGAPGQWAMTTRQGQPVLVWTEIGGSGPDLYFDPMCPQ